MSKADGATPRRAKQKADPQGIGVLTAIEGQGKRSDQVTEALKRYIVVNRLPPGAQLPPERQLADALMAGRNAVREALHSLVVLGIVEKRQGSGIYVREFDAEQLAEQLSYGLREDTEYWWHIMEARIAIELAIVPFVASRITRAQLAHLYALLETMREQIENEQSVARTDRDFHLSLAAAAANPVLERLARTVITEDFSFAAQLNLEKILRPIPMTIPNHEPLLAALAARDADASVEALRYHFRNYRNFVDTLTSSQVGRTESTADAISTASAVGHAQRAVGDG